MNKSDLVSRLAARLDGDRTTAMAAVNGVLEEIESSVARGERVSLIGFGTFDRRERAARTGRNPQTGATIQVAASVAPVFRPGAGFRSLLTQNGGSTVASTSKMVVASLDVTPKKKAAKKTAKKAVAADAGKGGKKAKQAEKKPAKKTGKKGR